MCKIPTIWILFYFLHSKRKKNITAVPELINNSPEVRNTLPHSQSRCVGGLSSG